MTPVETTAESFRRPYVRVRVNALVVQGDEILLVQHRPLFSGETPFWLPPGGGLELGETAAEGAAREVLEETGLVVTVGRLLYVRDFIRDPLHALELYFMAEPTGGTLKLGADPELTGKAPLLLDARFVPIADLSRIPLSPAAFATRLPADFAAGWPSDQVYLGLID